MILENELKSVEIDLYSFDEDFVNDIFHSENIEEITISMEHESFDDFSEKIEKVDYVYDFKRFFQKGKFKDSLKRIRYSSPVLDDIDLSWFKDYSAIESLSFCIGRNEMHSKMIDGLKEDQELYVKFLSTIPEKNLKEYHIDSLYGFSVMNEIKKIYHSELKKLKKLKNFDRLKELFIQIPNCFFDKEENPLKYFKDIEDLRNLSLAKLGIEDLTIIINYKSLKNEKLNKIDIRFCKVNWLNFDNGKTVQKLRQKGIDVIVDDKFYYSKPSNISDTQLVDRILSSFELNDDLKTQVESNLFYCIEEFRENQQSLDRLIERQNQGRASRVVSKVGQDNVYKITDAENYKHEFSIYSNKLGEFEKYKPNLIIQQDMSNEDIGILVMENLDLKAPLFSESQRERVYPNNPFFDEQHEKSRKAIAKSVNKKSKFTLTVNNNDYPIAMSSFVKQQGAENLYDYIDHYMYVLALFHSNKNIELNLSAPSYMKQTGMNFVDRVKSIQDNNYRKEIIDGIGNPEKYRGILEEINQEIVEKANCPLIGDFKIGNTVKGYVIDYDRVRVGHAVEDVAKFLEQAEFNLSDVERFHFIKRYNMHRAINDQSFGDEAKKDMFTMYNRVALNESIRFFGGKCNTDRSIDNSYYKQNLDYAIKRVRELQR